MSVKVSRQCCNQLVNYGSSVYSLNPLARHAFISAASPGRLLLTLSGSRCDKNSLIVLTFIETHHKPQVTGSMQLNLTDSKYTSRLCGSDDTCSSHVTQTWSFKQKSFYSKEICEYCNY